MSKGKPKKEKPKKKESLIERLKRQKKEKDEYTHNLNKEFNSNF